MSYKNFLINIREDVIESMKKLKRDTRVPMNVHSEQFLIEGLRKYGINLPDYQPVIDEAERKND
jgi:hypothetical protein